MSIISEASYATALLEARTELGVEKSLDSFVAATLNPERLTSVAWALAQPNVLGPLMDAYVSDSLRSELDVAPATKRVNLDSDGHPVESMHAIQLARGDGWSARLHVWLDGPTLTTDTHTHRADFGSVVLTGSFIDQVMALAPYGEGEPRYEYVNDGRDDPTREVTLRSIGMRVVPAGGFHTMGHQAIHSAMIAPEGVSATLVVRRPRTEHARVYTSGLRSGSPPTREAVDGAETVRILRTALNAS